MPTICALGEGQLERAIGPAVHSNRSLTLHLGKSARRPRPIYSLQIAMPQQLVGHSPPDHTHHATITTLLELPLRSKDLRITSVAVGYPSGTMCMHSAAYSNRLGYRGGEEVRWPAEWPIWNAAGSL